RLTGEKKIVAEQDVIHEYGRKVTLRQDEVQMRDRITQRFQSSGLQVPLSDELFDALKLDRMLARKIVQLLMKENILIKINDEIVIHHDAIEKLVRDVKNLKTKNPKLDVGEFKELTDVKI